MSPVASACDRSSNGYSNRLRVLRLWIRVPAGEEKESLFVGQIVRVITSVYTKRNIYFFWTKGGLNMSSTLRVTSGQRM